MRPGITLAHTRPALLARLRSEKGFGLVELLIAMVVTMIAVTALVATLSSSHVSLVRASRVSTAAAIASAELENYRARLYVEITQPSPPTADRLGADGRSYPTTTTVTETCPYTGVPPTCAGGGRPLMNVEVTVRDPSTSAVLVRESSAFEELTTS